MLQGEASLLTQQRTTEAEEMEGHYGAQVALCYQCKRCTSGCPLADVQEGALPVLYFTQFMSVAFGLSLPGRWASTSIFGTPRPLSAATAWRPRPMAMAKPLQPGFGVFGAGLS